MELIIDGIIYLFQKYGGISQLYTETLPRMCDLEPKLTTTLLIHPKGSQDNLPLHDHIVVRSLPDVYRYLRPHRFWDPYYPQLCQLAARPLLGKSKGKIWLSTYYTSPFAWAGPQVVFAHDFIHEKYRKLYWQKEFLDAEITIRNKASAIANADLVICNSETTRKDLLELYHIPFHKTVIVHLAHKSSFIVMEGMANKKKEEFILYVGRRDKYKDFAILLRSYANWSGRFEIGLVCAGGG
ncbi:MAG: glycosyltransferase, partial [Anaerolineaceae bacterium]